MDINKRSKKIVIISLLLITIFFFIGFYIYNYLDVANKDIYEHSSLEFTEIPQDMITEMSQDFLDLGNGYSLGVESNKTKQMIKNAQVEGRILMDVSDDTLEVSFSNNSDNEHFILKVFYDYEEVSFKILNDSVDDKFDTSFVFNLEQTKTIEIPIRLSSDILKENDQSHKLTVGVYVSPEKHAKNVEKMTDFYGMTMDYELFFGESGEIILNKSKSNVLKTFDDVPFQGVMINQERNISEPLESIPFPPYSIKAKKGEEIELTNFVNVFNYLPEEEVENYLILSMLDWKQIKMNGQPYLLLDANEGTDYGVFSITAPEKAGLYEFVAFIVPNADKNKNSDNFFYLDHAYRFTIEVVE